MNIELSTGKKIEVTPKELSELAQMIYEGALQTSADSANVRYDNTQPKFLSETVKK